MNVRPFARRRTVRLTTRGRKTGHPRTVKIWFVVGGPNRIYVQHMARAPAHWYRNLQHTPEVLLDFGERPVPAVAEPLVDVEDIRMVVKRMRWKYPFAWIIQLLGRGATPVAARITVTEGAESG